MSKIDERLCKIERQLSIVGEPQINGAGDPHRGA